MKRFLLFYGDEFYPGGGWADFHGSFDAIEEARNTVSDFVSWWEVVDSTTGAVVLTNEEWRKPDVPLTDQLRELSKTPASQRSQWQSEK